MKPKVSKLNQTEPQTVEQQHVEETKAGREFSTVDEMLRYDASQTIPPETIAIRLQSSLEQNSPKRAWWRRWFGL